MKRYWFYGNMPKDTITEKNLSEEQKSIIEREKERINIENFKHNWLGYKNPDSGWDFMRHGFEVIHVDEERGNIARNILEEIINKKYKNG